MKKVETTAADTKVVRTFARFAKSGYKPSLFTRDLYLALSRSFGFIAHYDRDGFYAARFGDSAARLDTLTIMGYETFQWALSALEQQFRKLVLDEGMDVAAAEQLAAETEKQERAELARLKAKYES